MSNSEPRTLTFNLSGFTVDDEGVDEYEKMLEERRKQDRISFYKSSKSGVPSKFWNESLETYIAETPEEERNKDAIQQFVKNPQNKVYILCGNNGNGKSHLASSVIRELGGKYITASDLCIEYESYGSFSGEMSRTKYLRILSAQVVLVIDECGKYTLNQQLEKFLLAYVLSARYEDNLPTILVTNASKKEFIEFLGISVFDRLTEVCTTLEFTEPSKRKARRE